jgi:hypothetical protein
MENNPDALQVMNALRKYHTHAHTRTHKIEFYSAIKMHGLKMHLEDITLSEVSQFQKDTYFLIYMEDKSKR